MKMLFMVLKGLSASKASVLQRQKECAQAFGQVSELSPHSGERLPFFSRFLHKANLHVLMMSALIPHAPSPLPKNICKNKAFSS